MNNKSHWKIIDNKIIIKSDVFFIGKTEFWTQRKQAVEMGSFKAYFHVKMNVYTLLT